MQIGRELLKVMKSSLGRVLQETGVALDHHGCVLTQDISYLEPLSRHRNVMSLQEKVPRFGDNVFISPNCSIIGSVVIDSDSVISYGSVLRADVNCIRIGRKTMINENVTIQQAVVLPLGVPQSVYVGNAVRVGSDSTLISCQIDDHVIIGNRVVVSEGVTIMRGSQISDNSYIPAGVQIPSNQLWGGSPVQFIKDLNQQDQQEGQKVLDHDLQSMDGHMTDFIVEQTNQIGSK